MRGAAAGLRLAELDRDDRLAGGARRAAGGLEFRQVRDRLDIDDDDLELGLVGEEGDVVADRQPGLVAAGDEVFGRDAALLQRLVGEDHHAAALADQRHRAGLARVSGRSSVSVTRRLLAQTLPMQLGPETPSPVCAITAASSRAERGGLGVEAFAEAGGEHGGAARAGRGAALERLDHARGRHQHHHVVGRLGQRLEVRIAGRVPDLGAARIDQVDRSGKLVLIEIAPHARGPASGPVAGADQHGVARRGERLDFFLRTCEVQRDVSR